MTRLIDADALAKVKFHGYPEIEITPSDVNAEAYKRGWNDAIDAIIESGPSIDAVKHGRWEEKEVIHYGQTIEEWQSAKCSVCGRYHTTPFTYYFKYCPNCGARMDAETRNNTEEKLQ